MNIGHILRQADPAGHETVPLSLREMMRSRIVAEAAGRVDSGSPPPGLTRRRALLIATMALVVAGSLVWPRATVHAAVTFEIRMADEQPSPGLTPVYVAASGQTVYVESEPVVTNDDIESAEVEQGDPAGTYGIHVVFTPGGAQKMFQATAAHIGGIMAILIDGETVMAPKIRSAVGSVGLITGTYTEGEAHRLADGIRVK